MNCKQINQIPFLRILEKIGIKPTKIKVLEQWYISPFRNEKEASFKVNTKNNTFYDFGEGTGGTIIDFWCKFHRCDIKTAIHEISNLFSFPKQVVISKTINNNVMNKTQQCQTIRIINVRPISSHALIDYLHLRELYKSIYPYIQEVLFEINGKRNFAIGFKNSIGGFELRNKLFKGCTSKAITLNITEKSDTVCLFEGFVDYLSYLENTILDEIPVVSSHFCRLNESYIILNSLSLIDKAIPVLNEFKNIKLFLDNDSSGRKVSTELKDKYHNIIDCSIEYSEFKDYNDYHISQTKKIREMMDALRRIQF
jgi:DNA primase (bacterial type)